MLKCGQDCLYPSIALANKNSGPAVFKTRDSGSCALPGVHRNDSLFVYLIAGINRSVCVDHAKSFSLEDCGGGRSNP
jgi:hypothetical protein